mgnify:CR=1 FL=1
MSFQIDLFIGKSLLMQADQPVRYFLFRYTYRTEAIFPEIKIPDLMMTLPEFFIVKLVVDSGFFM